MLSRKTLIITHPIFAEHDTGPGHPELSERIKVIWEKLNKVSFANELTWEEAPKAEQTDLERVHASDYIRHVFQSIPTEGYRALDPDTIISPASGEAALRAAGAIIRGVTEVLEDQAQTVFCPVRPPGHHAETNRAAGFCVFNNIAVGAALAQQKFGLSRVAIVDFDVHHGNGTQEIFWNNPNVFYGSTHHYPFYPGTGSEEETGAHKTICNIPLSGGTGSSSYRKKCHDILFPWLEGIKPELLLISAGFDAHQADPLGGLNLETEDYAWITHELLLRSGGRAVSILEGGYNLTALSDSVVAHVEAMLQTSDT